MSIIYAKNKWEEDTNITKKDIINIEKFDCDIFINEVKFYEGIKINKENNICIKFNKKYNDLSYMFEYCNTLISIDLSDFNTNNVTNMNRMFYNCESLTSINFSNFNTSEVTDISGMFLDVIHYFQSIYLILIQVKLYICIKCFVVVAL